MQFYTKINPLLVCIFLLVGMLHANAQSFTIRGQIMTEHRQPVEVGNVLLLSPADSALLKGDLFLDGVFEINTVNAAPVLLRLTALGFQDLFLPVEPKPGEYQVDLGTLVLASQSLAEVEVIGRQKLVVQRGGNLVVQVANTSLSNTGMAIDILRNTPKVLLSSSGQISVLGKGNALIYLDGQRIASSQILQSLSSNDVKEIEIIENPGAKYDAEGNAVINIVTKKNTLEGYKVDLVQEIGHGKHFRSYTKADVYYKVSKLLLQASYGIRPWTFGGREYYFRTFDFAQKRTEVDNQFHYSRKLLNQDFSFRSTYQLGPNQKIGLHYSGLKLHGEKDALNENTYTENGATAFTINTVVTGPYDQSSHTVNAFYEQTLDTLGSNLLVTGQSSHYRLDRRERIDQLFARAVGLTSSVRNSYNTNNIGVYSFQADYQKYHQTGWQWSAGIKQAYIQNQSQLSFAFAQEAVPEVPISELSNNYDYDENILAAYTQLAWAKRSLKAKIGLRGEWTRTNGLAGNPTEGQRFAKNYIDVFPSASLTHTFTEQNHTTLSYSYRIQRPQFQDLNPFVFYVDSLVSLRGNPNLIPEYSHAVSNSIVVNKWTFDLNYTFTKDKINTIIQVQDPENPAVFAFIRDNIESTSLFAVSASYPIEIGKYAAYLLVGGRLEQHKVRDTESILHNRRAGYYFYTNQSLQLPGDVKLEAIFQYTSPRVDGIYVDNPISYLNLAVSRKFFNNHLMARILFNDVFDRYKFTGIANFTDSHFTYLSEGDWHFVKLSLNWNFGKLGSGGLKEKRISEEELKRINRN